MIYEQYLFSFTTVYHSAHSKTRHALIGTCKKSSERKNHFAKYKKKFRTENFFFSLFIQRKENFSSIEKCHFMAFKKVSAMAFQRNCWNTYNLQRHLLLFFHSCFDKKQNIIVAYKTILSFCQIQLNDHKNKTEFF